MNQRTFATQRGIPYPLGATVHPDGVNFCLFSANAQKVELCLFDATGDNEIARIDVAEYTNSVWHIFVEGLELGALYGYRVHGPHDPKAGFRFDGSKLLLDPYAKKLQGEFVWHSSVYSFPIDDPAQDLVLKTADSAASVPKAVVTAPFDVAPAIAAPVPWCDTVIYELHVKGFTALNPKIPEHQRGTYAGLAHPCVIEYLLDLGITTVELLPVHSFINEHFLEKRDLVNYWGYNTLNFFTPHRGYLSSDDDHEFKAMVAAFHEAGIEVILDVVYNHTAEGSHLGPNLCFRGIDNTTYYGLDSNSARFYVNDTGCGNTLNLNHPRVMQLVLDSLRHWVNYYGVDGFRFDLATVLGREPQGFNSRGAFLSAIMQDPVLCSKKLIAEPWDIGPGGYQLGQFPAGWAEWNDRYRDTVRKFWRGDHNMLPEFAKRIHGSSDFFERSGRQPSASLNFITSHDGFTLRDLVSYNLRHNQDNKEHNKDGHHSNFSFNFGVEGACENPRIDELRQRQLRNFLATLILSQGTPMILAGDELGHSQNGNNNAYCQDNKITWFDWENLSGGPWDLKNFVRNVLKIRRDFPLLRSRNYVHKPEVANRKQGYNIHWLNQQGKPMAEAEWQAPETLTLGWMLESVVDANCVNCLLTLFNSSDGPADFVLPGDWFWTVLLDTASADGLPKSSGEEVAKVLVLPEKSMLILYGMSSQCLLNDQEPLLTPGH